MNLLRSLIRRLPARGIVGLSRDRGASSPLAPHGLTPEQLRCRQALEYYRYDSPNARAVRYWERRLARLTVKP